MVSLILLWYVFTTFSFLILTFPPHDTSTFPCWLWLVRLKLGFLNLMCSADSTRGLMMPRDLAPRNKVFKYIQGNMQGYKGYQYVEV